MAYTKNTWKTGDIVSSQKLNHMEDGIASASDGGVLIVNATKGSTEVTLDKTWKEIRDAFAVGVTVIVDSSEVIPIGTVDRFSTVISVNASPYEVILGDGSAFTASLDSDYPFCSLQ